MLTLAGTFDIIVNLPAQAVPTPSFSLGLILSQNTVISEDDRVKVYNSVAEMINAGFAPDSEEVAAATLYFRQSPAQLAVGVQGIDETPVEALDVCRATNSNWYICMYIGGKDSDYEALANYCETAKPSSILFYTLPTVEDDITDVAFGASVDTTHGAAGQSQDVALLVDTGYSALSAPEDGADPPIDITITVTAAGMTGSPHDVSVGVLDTDTTPDDVAGKIRDALSDDDVITAFFSVNGSNATASLIALTAAANDPTMAIVLSDAGSTGITAEYSGDPGVLPVSQVETAPVTHGASVDGTLTVTITANGMSGSPEAVSCDVAAGDSAQDVAVKVRAALSADTNITDFFSVGGTGANIVLTAIDPAADDATMSIVLTDEEYDLTNCQSLLAIQLMGSNYKRTLGQYSTITADAVASIMGYACAADNGSTSFTLDFKPEPGVNPENLTEDDAETLDSENLNYLTTRDNYYTYFQKGVMASGAYFDDILGIDMLTAAIQTAVMNILMGSSKVPQTDVGVNMFDEAISRACDPFLASGFLGAGIWNGPQVIDLNPGDSMPNGYSVQAASVSSLSPSDRAARKSPPIYLCISRAGAIQSLVLTIDVNS